MSAKSLRTCAGSPASDCTTSAIPASSLRAAATVSGLRPVTITFAPSPANTRAVARPIPVVPPVTTANLPDSLPMCLLPNVVDQSVWFWHEMPLPENRLIGLEQRRDSVDDAERNRDDVAQDGRVRHRLAHHRQSLQSAHEEAGGLLDLLRWKMELAFPDPPSQRLGQGLFLPAHDRCEQPADLRVARKELGGGVDQEAPASALSTAHHFVEDPANRSPHGSVLEDLRQPAMLTIDVSPQALQEQRALVAERVVQALPREARRLLQGGVQDLLPIELRRPGHSLPRWARRSHQAGLCPHSPRAASLLK